VDVVAPVTATQDDYLGEHHVYTPHKAGLPPRAIIKLDTETTKLTVLRGSRRTVDEYRPWIFLEVLPGRTEADLAKAMAGWEYMAGYLDGSRSVEAAINDRRRSRAEDFMWLSPRRRCPRNTVERPKGGVKRWSAPAGRELKV
jgi:hypothetical protein